MKVVKVLWIDSYNSNFNWTVAEDVDVEPIYIDSFGVVVKDTDEFLAIAQNYGNDPEQYSNITTIPKGCIKEVFVIHEDNVCVNGQKIVNDTDEKIVNAVKDTSILDMVEPKFKVGDWVVTDKNDRVQIKAVNNIYYTIDNGMYFNMPYVDRCWHLWTVQDAIDGDVLSNGDMILIFKEFEEPAYRQHIIAYIGLDSCGHIQVTVEHWELGIDKAKPATKEQCDTLMKAIKDAGYEWDIEKKELKKLTQSVTKISEQDAWSEEDENLSYWAIQNLTELKNRFGENYGVSGKCIDWLKSLKGRMTWKPSEEQMQVFEAVYKWYNNNFAPSETLTSLYNDLKKL